MGAQVWPDGRPSHYESDIFGQDPHAGEVWRRSNVTSHSMSVAMLQSYLFYVAYGAVSLALVVVCVWALLPGASESLERIPE